jgi:hypothetical protein
MRSGAISWVEILRGFQDMNGGEVGFEPYSGLIHEECFEFSDLGSRPKKAVAVGVSAFVTEGFVRRLKAPPFVWIGPELTALVAKGRSPLLS